MASKILLLALQDGIPKGTRWVFQTVLQTGRETATWARIRSSRGVPSHPSHRSFSRMHEPHQHWPASPSTPRPLCSILAILPSKDALADPGSPTSRSHSPMRVLWRLARSSISNFRVSPPAICDPARSWPNTAHHASSARLSVPALLHARQ
jgi:hypothetical protein